MKNEKKYHGSRSIVIMMMKMIIGRMEVMLGGNMLGR